MKQILLIAALLVFSPVAYGQTDIKAMISVEQGVATMEQTEAPDTRVPRSECTQCAGKGWYWGGDGRTHVKVQCDNCYDDGGSDGDVGPPATHEATIRLTADEVLQETSQWQGTVWRYRNWNSRSYFNRLVSNYGFSNDQLQKLSSYGLMKLHSASLKGDIKPTKVESRPGEAPEAPSVQRKILYFGATWCGPCQTQGEVVDALKAEGYHVEKYDTDEDSELANEYGINNIPAWVFVEDGRAVFRYVGATDAEQIKSLHERVFSDED